MQGLISNLVRPFRFRYSPFDLGPKFTSSYQREDSTILNDRGFKIQYSYYQNNNPSSTCLVYAHCNSGCRVEGLQFVQPAIQHGWNVCLFDFAGSGISEGEYISLGYYEWMDLQAVISVVLKKGNSKIHLWGRSMGAATIILYLSETKQIDTIISCVLDSPYSSLWRVIKQFGNSKTKIPSFIVEHVMEYLRNSIFKDHRFDIKQLDLVKKIQKIDIPIMFIASTSDSFVNCDHASELYKWAPNSHKVLEYIEKEHNSPRESTVINTGLAFLEKSFSQKEQNKRQLRILSRKKELYRNMTGNNMAELITRPSKISIQKNHINSTGSLARFNSFCLNNNQIIVQLSPKCQKNREKKQNPHKIQESIIKLTLPSKEILEQIRKANRKQESLQNTMRVQVLEEIASDRKLDGDKNRENKKEINKDKEKEKEKENIQNASNKSDWSEDERLSKGSQGIKTFNNIITKRFNFENRLAHEQIFREVNGRETQTKERRNKTQKISICLRNQGNESPTKSKPYGIKLFKKFQSNQEKQHRMLNKSENRQLQILDKLNQNIKERVKTEAPTRMFHVSSCSSSEEKLAQQYFREMDRMPKPKGWMCGEKQLCYGTKIKNKEGYLNKFCGPKVTANQIQDYQQKLSYNDQWGADRQSDLIVQDNIQQGHFRSLGETEEYTRKSDTMLAKQRIIKIQLDRNIFNQKKREGGLKMQKMGKQKSSISMVEENPMLQKLKLKHRRLSKKPENQQKKIEGRQ